MAPYAVDEVKDLRDKALALERHSAQTTNLDAERKAVEIRLRAERKCGQLLKKAEEVKKGRKPKQMSSDTTFK